MCAGLGVDLTALSSSQMSSNRHVHPLHVSSSFPPSIILFSAVRGAGKVRELRTGYRGHIVQLANQLIVTGKDRPCLAEAFRTHPRWQHFVQHELRHANEVCMHSFSCFHGADWPIARVRICVHVRVRACACMMDLCEPVCMCRASHQALQQPWLWWFFFDTLSTGLTYHTLIVWVGNGISA